MDKIIEINSAVNGFVWGPIMLALLVGTGIYLSFRVGFIQGTNNSEMLKSGFVSGMTSVGNDLYLTHHDRMWEVNLDTQYQIYKDLTLAFELGYINLDYDENLWGTDAYHENNFKAAMSLNYKF